METRYDVVVVGGGAAGLSGGVTLARARRSVLVLDTGSTRNRAAAGVHGFLGRDGVPPDELTAAGRAEVTRYGGEIVAAEAVAAERGDDGFAVTLADRRVVGARRLLVTTGLTDELPDVEGLAERWGRDVVHCPYCHGWEIRDLPIGVLATGSWGVHQALLFRQWSPDVTLFVHTGPEPDGEQAEQLAARGIRVVTGTVVAVETGPDGLTGVRLADGTVVPRRAVALASRLVANSAVLASLGLKPTPDQRGIGEAVAADPAGATEVPGVWVAGNVTDLVAQVVAAAAGGVLAAGAINADLVAEDTRLAVEAHRAGRQEG